ncbi:Glucan 1,3-beta-glucosidase [Colletotrichum tanaceti]|nr:Glucan 1,3-beta-glucosidase [Colletotrichum tanaceti]KAJ0168009.1 Glucan 1,3-beta-glucosidase [Colletotrichum tanaceti]
MNDLDFYGGQYGANFGNQQYTLRNARFFNAQVAINQLWDWGWTYKSIYVENCGTGIRMQDNSTASVTLIDSQFVNVRTAIHTSRDPGVTVPPTAGTLVLENVAFSNVGAALMGPKNNTIIQGSRKSILNQGFAMGHVYTPAGPTDYTGSEASYFPVYPALLASSSSPISANGTRYYERSRPHYEGVSASCFISARSFGAKGDGVTDDTAALNNLFNYVTADPSASLIAFVDAGTYYVSDTVFIPPGARIVGEALASIIMGGGPRFQDMTRPHPVVKVAIPGQRGVIEWSDMIVSTRGPAAGAKVIEYNLNSLGGAPSGMWDVHVRVGGYAGTQQQLEQCPTTPNATVTAETIDDTCVVAWMSMHLTRSSSNVLMENCWLWIADHDLEDPLYTQITVYAGRGLLIESTDGRVWLSASGSEHHTLYQYQLYQTRDVYMGQVQSETPYYQPNPPATIPFPRVEGYHDPDFETDCRSRPAPGPGVPQCAMAWGLRIIGSRNVVAFGAGHYSFFNNYSTDCCQIGAGTQCQQRIVDVCDASGNSTATDDVRVHNLQIVGTQAMVTRDGKDVALFKDNVAGFTAGIALYRH